MTFAKTDPFCRCDHPDFRIKLVKGGHLQICTRCKIVLGFRRDHR